MEAIQERARTGPLILLLRRAFAVLVGLASTATIAHLVSPRQFGLAAMSSTVFALAELLRDFGLSSAILRKGTIDSSEITFLFWFNAVVTLVLSILLALAAPLVAAYYHQPVVTWTVLTSLVGFCFGGLALQHRAIMDRDLRFGEIAIIDTVALLAGFATTLTVASLRHDVWSIVFGNLVQSSSSALMTMLRCRWRPGRPRRVSGLAEILQFGANTSVFSLSIFISNTLPPVLIGGFIGASALGSFNRATTLLALPATNFIIPLSQAVMPVLTRLRPHPELYRETYLTLVRRLSIVLVPSAALLTITAPSLVEAVLGSRWRSAGLALSILSPTIAGFAHAYSVGDIFVTQNRTRELRNLGLVEVIFRSSLVIIALRMGLIGAATAMLIATSIVQVGRMIVAGRSGPITFADQLRATLPALPSAAGAIIGCVLARMIFGGSCVIWCQALSQCVAGTLFGLAGGMVIPASRAAITDLFMSLVPVGRAPRLLGRIAQRRGRALT